jgi:hypothetical protein
VTARAAAKRTPRLAAFARFSTPQSTVEAIVHCVRERGVGALREPANIERLSCCDEAASEQINKRIDALLRGEQAR